MAKISVIVPVYNVEKYLPRCIDSILAQTFTDFELILVDDGSPDNCGAICDEYAVKDSRICVIHQKNQGVSAARNTGIEASKGEYVTFIDSDDYIESVFFRDAVDAICANKADIFLAGHKAVRNQEIVRESIISEEYCLFMQELSEKQMTDLLEKSYIASCWGKLISRALIGDIRFDLNMNFGEDLKFMHEIIRKSGTLYAAEKAYYNYWIEDRGRTNLTSLMSEKKCLSVVKTYRILFGVAKKWEAHSQYWRLVADRWLTDYRYMEQMIFRGSESIWKQHRMWRVLLCDPEMRSIVLENTGKSQHIYINYPILFLLKRYISQIKRKIWNRQG